MKINIWIAKWFLSTHIRTIVYYWKDLLEYVLCLRVFLTTLEHYKFQTIFPSITRKCRISSCSTYLCLKNELLNQRDLIINVYKTDFWLIKGKKTTMFEISNGAVLSKLACMISINSKYRNADLVNWNQHVYGFAERINTTTHSSSGGQGWVCYIPPTQRRRHQRPHQGE